MLFPERGADMRRREFLGVVGGMAVGWPLAASAQPSPRRIGMIFPFHEGDSEAAIRLQAFEASLVAHGWAVGRNLHIDYRWTGGDARRSRQMAEELVSLSPDAILSTGGATLGPLLQVTRTIPIVFVRVTDPVGAGYVESLARPGGNATGFAIFEYGTSSKWLQLLKDLVPKVERVAVLRDATLPSGTGQLSELEKAASSIGVALTPIHVGDVSAIETGLQAFASAPNGGMIVGTSAPATVHRARIIALAARYRLPAIYPYRYFANEGGLAFYGPDTIRPYRDAAEYVHRIISGQKPAELPVQAQTKFELVINLKTARTLGLDVPPTLLALSDEVIE